MFVRTMLKLAGSVETVDQVILLSLLRSMVEPSAGEVTWSAKVDATSARKADEERVNCILIADCLLLVGGRGLVDRFTPA